MEVGDDIAAVVEVRRVGGSRFQVEMGFQGASGSAERKGDSERRRDDHHHEIMLMT